MTLHGILSTKWSQMVLPNTNVHLIGMGGFITPGEIWAHSDRPLNTPDDLVGLKMRVAGDGGEVLSRMGVATVHLLLLVSFIEPN